MMKHYKQFTEGGDYDLWYLPAERKTRSDSKKVRAINNKTIFTFDIETTSFEYKDQKMAYCYVWGCCINGQTYYGRYLEEFVEILDMLNNDGWIQICWVHNLSYEFQFLRSIVDYNHVFARTKRKPIFARYKNIEFRCTYFLSNMSLASLADSYKLDHKKLVGDLNYTKMRNSLTPLTSKDLGYLENDVLVLYDYINYLMRGNGRKMKEIPYTQTGYVRKALLAYTKEKKEYYALRKLIKVIHPTMELFLMLEDAFAGGITHANYLTVIRETIDNVWSYDRRSSYPAVMCSCKYPMTRFFKISRNYHHYVGNEKYAWVARVKFHDLESRYDMAITSKHKCKKVIPCRDEFGKLLVPDSNGRIWKAKYVELTITDVDYHNMERMYKWSEVEFENMWVSEYDYLPKVIVEFILQNYQNKTSLKGVKGSENLYMHSKQNINGIYGDMVLNPFTDDILYDNEDGWDLEDATPEKLETYYENPKTIKTYQWGVWVTAHARSALVDGLVKVGNDADYSDTDSIKGEGDHEKDFEELNVEIRELNRKASEHFRLPYELWKPKSPDGEEQELGTWDFEGNYDQFKTLGAKRYAYVQDGKIHATVAGSPKGAIEAKIKSLDEFENGLVLDGKYNSAGKNESRKVTMTYIDGINADVPLTDYNGVTEIVHIGDCIHASGATFEMGRSTDYVSFLKENMISDKKFKIRKGVYQ